MPVDRFSRLTLGTNLTGTDQGDGELLIDAAGGGTETLPASIVDAKGDLISATAADTPARLAVGTNAQVLTADSAEATGLKWTTPSAGAAGALTLLHTLTLGSAGTFDQSGISGAYNDLVLVLIARGADAGATETPRLTLNNDTGSNYMREALLAQSTTASAVQSSAQAFIAFGGGWPAAAAVANLFGVAEIIIYGYASTTWKKTVQYTTDGTINSGSAHQTILNGGGTWHSTAAVTRVTIVGATTANWVTGSQLRIYGRL